MKQLGIAIIIGAIAGIIIYKITPKWKEDIIDNDELGDLTCLREVSNDN